MAIECPHCRAPVAWHRAFRTPAWGSWICSSCRSRLGVNLRRRLVAVAICLALSLFAFWLIPVPATWDAALVLSAFAIVLVPYFIFFEKPMLLERHGLHCNRCGYDLHGLEKPRCPECGTDLDDLQKQMLAGGPDDRPSDSDSSSRKRIMTIFFVVVLVGLTISLVIGTWFAGAGFTARTMTRDTQRVLDALRSYPQQHEGRWPGHALHLTASGDLQPPDFVTFDSLSDPARVAVGGTDLKAIQAQTAAQSAENMKQALAVVSPAVTVHRLGDFVFTYHGMEPAMKNPDLWLVIWWPDPSQNAAPAGDESIPIGLASGKVILVKAGRFRKALDRQNALRAKRHLSPLPHPYTVGNLSTAGNVTNEGAP